jgi:hypothetical protein
MVLAFSSKAMKRTGYKIDIFRRNFKDLLIIFFVITPLLGTAIVLTLFRVFGLLNDAIYH